MARSHGRLSSSIWNDADFIALDRRVQGTYAFLLSQPDLSHAGLVPMRTRRWAMKAGDMSAGSIRDDLDILAHHRFIVIDDQTEEVLLRTFVKNDGVYKQPKVMLRMREDARLIESPKLRAAFLVELGRLPLDELSATAGGQHHDQPSTRQVVGEIVDTLRDDFADAEGYPIERVCDTPHVRAGALPHPPSPYPHPPSPIHQPPATDAAAAPASAVAVRAPDRFEEFWNAYGKKVGKGKAAPAFRKAAKKADPLLIIKAAHEHADFHDRQRTEARFVPHPATWLNEERWLDERSARDELGPRSRRQDETDGMFDAAMQRAVERDQADMEARA